MPGAHPRSECCTGSPQPPAIDPGRLFAETHVALTVVTQAGKELRDERLLAACAHLEEQGLTQKAWLENQIKHRAPHTLVVPQ